MRATRGPILIVTIAILCAVSPVRAQSTLLAAGGMRVIEDPFSRSVPRSGERAIHTGNRLRLTIPSVSVAAVGHEASRFQATQAPRSQQRDWIGRHPVLFGALVGFGSGFLVGYVSGDDGVFNDFTAQFNGWMMGGIGAGTGALIGYAVSLK